MSIFRSYLLFCLIVCLPHYFRTTRSRKKCLSVSGGKQSEKAYFELKNGKKHTDPAEKAFISTLRLLRENKNDQALEMAKMRLNLVCLSNGLAEPRDWMQSLHELSGLRNGKKKLLPQF